MNTQNKQSRSYDHEQWEKINPAEPAQTEQRDTLECDNCGKPTDLEGETGEQVCHKCGLVYGDAEQRDTAQPLPRPWTQKVLRALLSRAANRAMCDEYVQDICDLRNSAVDNYKAHAERLAEAVKLAYDWFARGKTVMTRLDMAKAMREALGGDERTGSLPDATGISRNSPPTQEFLDRVDFPWADHKP